MPPREKKSPAFQFYPDDFLGSGKVGQMTVEEIGIFTLLLCLDWNDGGFSFDAKRLAHFCRVTPKKFAKCWRHISKCFEERDGRMFSPRLELERIKQAEWREKSSLGGKKGSDSRWHKGGQEKVITNESPSDDTPSPSPTPLTTNTTAGIPKGGRNEYPPEFELLWNLYPRRKGGSAKQATFNLYLGHLKRGVAYDVMVEGTKRYNQKCMVMGWIGTEFVKDAQTFFGRGKHFLDDHSVDAPVDAEAPKLWRVMKDYGFTTATRFTIDADLARAKADGKITDTEAFKSTLRKLNRDALKTAKTDQDAERIIAQSLAGSKVEGLAA